MISIKKPLKKTIKKRLLIIISLYGIFLLAIFSRLIYTMIDDQEQSSKVPLIEHNNLFTKEVQDKLKLLAATKSKNREPTSNYIYDKRFNVFVQKVNLTSNNGLKNIINYQNEPSHISMDAVYSGLSDFNMDMKFKLGTSVSVSSVNFKFSGDSIRLIQGNDSLYCYYLKFKTFSINYNNEPYNIIAKADETSMPTSIAFIKKKKSLYIIIMTVSAGKEEMQPDQLYSIINK